MKNFLTNFLHKKTNYYIFIAIVLTTVSFNNPIVNVSSVVYAQDIDITWDKIPVTIYYFNGKLKIKHKEKVKHEIFKDSATGKVVRSADTQYYPNGHIKFLEEYQYDLDTSNRTSLIRNFYDEEEDYIIQSNEYLFDPKTDEMTRQIQTVYQSNGEISYIKEFHYSPGWKMPISDFVTEYYNGKIFSKVEIYWDINTHEKEHSVNVSYDENGIISSKTEEYWDVNTGKITRRVDICYFSEVDCVKSKEEYYYVSDDEYPESSTYIEYDTNGNAIKKEKYTYNSKTGERIKQ